MTSRPVRSLEHLENTASTTRVLNLRAVAVRFGSSPEYRSRPLFRNPLLNKAIIVKHRLRQNEQGEFDIVKRSATKVLLPIETANLGLGARYVFIGQRNFQQVLHETLGIEANSDDPDYRVLEILDKTPSLDPFLLREQLKVQGFDAASCYFDISQADLDRMFAFAQGEIQQLVEMSFGGGAKVSAHAAKLARKILTDASDAELEPLRLTMQLSPQQYQEGVFCWKAFIYYKWRLTNILREVTKVADQISHIAPRGEASAEMKSEIAKSKDRIRQAIMSALRKVRETIGVYDGAYEGLTKHQEPARFRDFLLRAPAMFNDLGERLGAVDHIVSFWGFRFPPNIKPFITADELLDIFTDFEQSLAFGSDKTEKSPMVRPTVISA